MNPKQLVPLAILGACTTGWAQLALEPLWSIAPGTTLAPGVTLGGAGSNTERGLAYNPFTGHVLVVSRNESLKVIVLEGATGNYVGTMNVTGVSGGTFALNMIDVAENGQIYAANLTTSSSTSPFKVYQWANEAAAPVNVYSGDPAGGAYRFGDTFRVRSGSVMVEVIAGAGSTGANFDNILAHIPSFDDGATFDPAHVKGIPISGIGDGDMRLGLSFGPEFTIYADQNNTLRYIAYDPFAGTGSLLESYSLVSGAGTPGPNAYHHDSKLFASLTFHATAGEQRVNLYDATQFVNGGSVNPIDFEALPTQNANANGVGNLDFSPDGSLLFVVSPNNGIMAYQVIPEPTPLALLALAGLAYWLRRRR